MQTKKRKARKLYFGWIIVGVAFLNMALQYTTNVNLGGLFVSALETEFSSSRTAVTTTLTLFSFGALFGALFANAILQRVPLRRVLIVARIATIVGFVGNAFSTSLPQIYVLSLIRGFCGPILTVIPTAIILNNWFSPKKRGKVIGIAMCGSGVGAMILTPITTAIISDMGWRTAYMFFAALALLLLPLTVYAFVGTPEEKGYPPVNVDTHKRIAQSKRVLEEKTGNYHKNGLLCLAFVGILILAGTSQTWNTSASAYLTGIGFDPVTTTSVLSISAFFVIIGKLGLGAICDRWGARASIYIGGGSICLTYAILLIVEYVPALVFLAAATIGIGMSVVTIGIPVLCSDLLSDRPYQSSVGYLNVASNLGGATLPLTIAAIYDTTQHYGLAWSYATTIAFGAVILICIAYRKKSQTTLLCQK